MDSLEVIYDDNQLLVVNKPAGIATMGAETGPTVHSLAADYIKRSYHKPGKAFIGVVSRLDAMTSGVLVLARTSKAASRLAPQFGAESQTKKNFPATRAVKIYLTAVEGKFAADRGRWVDHVRKDDAARRMRVVDETARDAQLAELDYCKIADVANATIVAVRLLTGRKHQIRLQFADHGHPVIGDRKYGSERQFRRGVALHSWCLQITHPTLRQRCVWRAALPAYWKPFKNKIPSQDQLAAMVDDAFGLQLGGQQGLPADDGPETT